MNGFPDLADLEDRGRFRGYLGTDGDGLLNELLDALLVGVFYSMTFSFFSNSQKETNCLHDFRGR